MRRPPSAWPPANWDEFCRKTANRTLSLEDVISWSLQKDIRFQAIEAWVDLIPQSNQDPPLARAVVGPIMRFLRDIVSEPLNQYVDNFGYEAPECVIQLDRIGARKAAKMLANTIEMYPEMTSLDENIRTIASDKMVDDMVQSGGRICKIWHDWRQFVRERQFGDIEESLFRYVRQHFGGT